MDYSIKIDAFEGPLDLLLHLIKKANIDIYDINIEEITKQYLDYINKMEELNIDIASSYLVMAAELIELKSKLLLPNQNNEENEEEENTKENLIQRLLNYERYKDIATSFKELENNRQQIFIKGPENINKYTESKLVNTCEYNVDVLYNAFLELLKRRELEKPISNKITTKEYSVSVRIKEIKEILKIKKTVNFDDLFDSFSKDFVIVTFLSVLDMVKNNEIVINQDQNFSKITISLKGCEQSE